MEGVAYVWVVILKSRTTVVKSGGVGGFEGELRVCGGRGDVRTNDAVTGRRISGVLIRPTGMI
jgi:hypothetical protein